NRAFFKAYEHLASYDESRPLRAWLLRIAANEALNELRGRRRDAAHALGGAEAEAELAQISGGPDPGEIIPRRAHHAAILDAVSPSNSVWQSCCAISPTSPMPTSPN